MLACVRSRLIEKAMAPDLSAALSAPAGTTAEIPIRAEPPRRAADLSAVVGAIGLFAAVLVALATSMVEADPGSRRVAHEL
jgi:hypothetical protein